MHTYLVYQKISNQRSSVHSMLKTVRELAGRQWQQLRGSSSVNCAQAEPTQKILHNEEYIYMRDGFQLWAMIFSVAWCIYKRLWFIAFLIICAVLALNFLQNHEVLLWPGKMVITFLISLYLGLEGSTLLQHRLRQRGYKLVSIIVAHDLEEAEYKFLASVMQG